MAEEINNGLRPTGLGAETPEPLVKARRGTLRNPWPDPTASATMTPDSLLKMFWRSRWILLLCTVGSLGAGLAYISQCTPVFTSVSKLYVQQKMVSPPGVDTRSMPRYNLYTQAELVKSTSVLSVAFQQDPALERMRTFAKTDNTVAYLQRNLQVAVGKNDDVITVSFDSPYPVEAAKIVNVVVDAYISDHDKHRQRTSTEMSLSLSAKLDKERAERDKKLLALTQFKKDNPSLALESDQNASLLQQYLRLQTEHTDARLQVLDAESRKQRIIALADHPELLQPAGPTGSGAPAAVSTERSQLEAKLFEKTLGRIAGETVFTANHEYFGNIDKEIEQIKTRMAEIDKEAYATALSDAEQRCIQARQREAQIAGLLEEERREMVAHSSELAEYARLKEDYEHANQFCETLDQQIRGMNVNDDFEPQEIRVLEVAHPQTRPSRPQRARIMAIALVLGLLVGGAVSLVRDMLDQTIRSADEIQKLLGLSVLGVIPSMTRRQKASWRGQKTRLQPDSQEAEAFRTVRTAIVFGAAKENARTILVTSPSAGDGKSTLVSNLAIAMAQAGQKTIVLDADFRKPTQHILFGSDADRQGLIAALSGKATLAQAIQSTGIEGLSLLSCGSSVPNPAETLSSQVFVQVLRRLAQVYDRVILDAPPIMAVTDARVLGALCDITVLVLRADRSRRHICQRAIDALEATGSHLVGAVVNDVGRKGERFGYYGGYYAAGHNGGKARQTRRREVVVARHQAAARSLSKEGAST
jgi:succinoglycan biosynthesis transport protein ExoP